MSKTIIVFDLETAPDLAAVARVHGLDPGDVAAAQAKLGSGFPKLLFHRICCIGALIAEFEDGAWRIKSVGAPHVGERCEAHLIRDFAARIGQLQPQLVTFAGHSFDLPVLRYRALLTGVEAPGLTCRPYFRRYDDAALDLCDVLGNFEFRAKVGLDALCRAMGWPGKLPEMDGSKVADLVAAGRLDEVSRYCLSDVTATYRLFLAYERLRGALDTQGYDRSVEALDVHQYRQSRSAPLRAGQATAPASPPCPTLASAHAPAPGPASTALTLCSA